MITHVQLSTVLGRRKNKTKHQTPNECSLLLLFLVHSFTPKAAGTKSLLPPLAGQYIPSPYKGAANETLSTQMLYT